MASPPFSLSTSLPGDSDIVSQFPGNERPNRDIIQSWILANHDSNGNHAKAVFPWQSSTPATPSASLSLLYADAVGRLRVVNPDGTVTIVGVAPGNVQFTAAPSIPVGYLVADGSAVSRTTYADLFAVLSTKYGVGNGTTTFNLPDINGRVIAGEDNAAGRLISTYLGTTAVQGAVGGADHGTLILANLPPITPTGTIANGAITTIITNSHTGGDAIVGDNSNSFASAGSSAPYSASGAIVKALATSTQATSTFTGTGGGGSSSPVGVVQPTIVLKAIIKT